MAAFGCAAALAAVPFSPALAAPGDTQFTCGSAPGGWVVIQVAAAGCTTIEQVTGFAVGTTMPVCATSPVPAGWTIVYSGFTMGGCSYNWGQTGYGKQITRTS